MSTCELVIRKSKLLQNIKYINDYHIKYRT